MPFRAVINDACELPHRYSGAGAVAFANGVLDPAAHQVYPEVASASGAEGAGHQFDEPLDADEATAVDHDLDADFGDTPLRGAGDPAGEDA